MVCPNKLFQPKYTMLDFEVHQNSTANTKVYLRVVRTLLTLRLGKLMPKVKEMVKDGLQLEIQTGRKGKCFC